MVESRNVKFNILSALGMILIVGFHSGFIFIDWFSNPFHIPLFMFISGYFFKERPFGIFIIRKIRHLLIPFLAWNIFYGAVSTLLLIYGFTRMDFAAISLKSLFWDPFTYAHPFIFNGPGWFVGTLLGVQILYCLIYKAVKGKLILLGGVSILVYLMSLEMTFHGWTNWFYQAGLAIERILYCFVFYYLGCIYKIKFERKEHFSLNFMIILFFINALIIAFFTPNITNLVDSMTFPKKSYWLPFVVACTGILACLQFVDLLLPQVKENKLLNYIGNHSFSIMLHHQFFFWILNTFLLGLKKAGILSLNTFDYESYMTYIYFRITAHPPVDRLIYLIAGIGGPLICCWFYERYIHPYIKTCYHLE